MSENVQEKKKKFSWTDEVPFEILRLFTAIVVALLISFLVLCFVSDNPVNDFVSLLTYPFKSTFYFSYVLVKMIPLVFAGLATLLYFRASLFNLGTEGVFYISGVFMTFFAVNPLTGIGIIDQIICIAVAALAGGLISLLPGFLKAKWNADVMVISLMMNNILFGVGLWIVRTFLQPAGVSGNSSEYFADSVRLTRIMQGTQVTTGIIIALVMVAVVWVLLYKTKLGYQLRMTGSNARFAAYSGMSAFGLMLLIHFISGAIAGMGSAVELLGNYQRFSWSTLPGLGFTGALMAMMGKNNPIGATIAAFGISYLRASAQLLANTSPVIDVKMISIVEVILTLLISSQYFLRSWRNKQMIKEKGGE